MRPVGHLQGITSLNRDESDAAMSRIGMHLCISIQDAAFMGLCVTPLLTEESHTCSSGLGIPSFKLA